MNWIRWKLFSALSSLGWWICPEPQRSAMQRDWEKTIAKRTEDYRP